MATTTEHRNGPAMVRPGSVVDGVYEAIYEKLMALMIPPGARIMIDNLARELSVSQTPVREALSRLEREGLVHKEHLIGYSASPQLSRKQFSDLYEFRLLLEPVGARLAAQNMTQAALARLDRLDAELGSGQATAGRSSHYARFARMDAVFHDEIMKIADNEVIRNTLFNQHVHLHIFRFMVHTSVTREALEEHQVLIAALRAGDGPAAETAMRNHVERSRDRLLTAFD